MKRKFVIIAALVLVAGVLGFFWWKRGTPYQERCWSPNGQYYVQKYSNVSPSGLIGSPGHGSDAIDGYIRLYDKNGKLLHERFQTFIRDIKPAWAGNKVYLIGVAEMDTNPWILPGASE